MKYYTYVQGSILSSNYTCIQFRKGESLSIEYDRNSRIEIVTYPEHCRFSELPSSMCEVITDSEINLNGNVFLSYKHTLNGLEFYLKNLNNLEHQTYIFSAFIDVDTPEIKFEFNEVGGWLSIPSDYSNIEDCNSKIIEQINSSPLFFVRGEFEISNIVGVDLNEKNVKENYESYTPYGDYEKVYVNEADIVAAFIKALKEKYPQINFFPQSSQRKNLGRENCFYRTRLNRDRSDKFNSIVLNSPFSQRLIYTTIPMELHYETNDIAQYTDRRSMYLLSKFFMEVVTFELKKTRRYSDRFGNLEDTFEYAVYWTRDVEDDLIRQDAPDGSGRDTFALTIYCDLICSIIEDSRDVVYIQDVISNIYMTHSN